MVTDFPMVSIQIPTTQIPMVMEFPMGKMKILMETASLMNWNRVFQVSRLLLTPPTTPTLVMGAELEMTERMIPGRIK